MAKPKTLNPPAKAQEGQKNRDSSAPKTKTPKTVEKVEQEELPKLSWLKNPVQILHLFSVVFFRFLRRIFTHIIKHVIPYALLVLAIVLPHVFKGAHSQYVAKVDEVAEFALYWIILGVASSIGLGTGLHTFVLYLGPHIAKITMVANECNAIPEFFPSRWAINPTFGDCPLDAATRPQISFFDILWQVQLESLLWGFGTALGELPPYFVALAASKAGKTSEELDELTHSGATSIIDKLKLIIYKNLTKYAFFTVLLCASIPNPLFDLAGITCGHFGISFWTFFGATAIGKSIIKVHLQMIFVIFVFSRHHVENLLSFVNANVPSIGGVLLTAFEKQKKMLHAPTSAIPDSKPLVAVVWDYFITAMIGYFILATIQALAQGEFEKRSEEKKERKEK